MKRRRLGFDRFGGLGLLAGRGIDSVLVARRKLLAQRHPMATPGSLGIGRFVGPAGVRRLSRRFSARGQIT
jgi:hypothetical protein